MARRQWEKSWVSQTVPAESRKTAMPIWVKELSDDHAALRRYLVDEGFLSRQAGVYWRSGGTVDVQPAT